MSSISDSTNDDEDSNSDSNSDSFVLMEVEDTKHTTGTDTVSPTLTLSVAPKHEVIGLNSSMATTQVCATIRACGLAGDDDDTARASVDIVVALDLSSSMRDGTKLELCKQTLELLLRCLSPKDRFGLVTFADDANIDIPLATLGSTPENTKEAITSKIQALQASGCTNISAAIGLAAQEMNRIRIQEDNPHNNVRSVFLLSDGCANRGVTRKAAIVELTKGCLTGPTATDDEDEGKGKCKSNTNTTLHCFGYGSDHDEEIMQALSETAQGGTYYFVEGDSNVATAFGDALGGVLSVVAQNVMVHIRPNVDVGAQIMHVYHDRKHKEESDDGSYVVSLGDFYAEEKRDVLFSVSLALLPKDGDGASSDSIAHAAVSVSYLDTIHTCLVPETASNDTPTTRCMIARPPGFEVSKADDNVLLQWLRVKTAQDLGVADDMSKKGDLSGARAFLQSCLATFREQPTGVQKSPLLQQLVADLNCVMSNLTCEPSYRNYGSKMMGRMRQGHTMQRCNEMSASLQDQNTYRTNRKKFYSTAMGLGSSNSNSK
jgi:Mg-chelatase subunit ChlD/ABC-type dipeptide/oligopeptide/nickel transport system ATPase component